MLSITVFFIYNIIFFAGLILLHIFIVIMIITFINKIMRWKLCDRWMDEKRMIYRNVEANARIPRPSFQCENENVCVRERCRSKNPHEAFSSN